MLKSEAKLKVYLSLLISVFFLIFYCLNAYFFGEVITSITFLFQAALVGILGFLIIFSYSTFANSVVRFLNQQQITHNQGKRWMIEFFLVVFSTALLTLLTYKALPVPLGFEETKQPIQLFAMMFLPNFSFGVIIFAIIGFWNAIQQNRDLRLTLSNIEKEKVTSQLAALQQKVNPHFLFNSLSVLSELIYEDQKKADAFVQEFTKVYRYVLDFNTEIVVKVEKELEFLNAYLFLQKMRFGESLKIKTELEDKAINQCIPPLSLQLLFENAIKHNRVCKSEPLLIHLKNSEDYLIVTNTIQPRLNVIDSKEIGLSNLKKTYNLISKNQPEFQKTETEFIAKIPLINSAL